MPLVQTKSRYRPPVFPFSALVGQELLKKALVLSAANSRLAGVLIRGDKGTAKSTAVRALASLLHELEEVADCPYHCDPADRAHMCFDCRERMDRGEELPVRRHPVRVVDLPLNTTEDRLVGSIDFEHALKTGRKKFQPGLLAEANRGIIYIDEVNLLADHLVDILLDTAVTGLNIVERESVSVAHPSRYMLIATMNPEEGDIRPQLLDRFGFVVNIEGIGDPWSRMEVAKRREAFDGDPAAFLSRWAAEEDLVRRHIVAARKLLPEVCISEKFMALISQICAAHQVAGHRADIIMEKAARTLAALAGRTQVIAPDVSEAAELTLPHRVRELSEDQMREQQQKGGEDQEQSEQDQQGEEAQQSGKQQTGEDPRPGEAASSQDGRADGEGEPEPNPGNVEDRGGPDPGGYREQVFKIGEPVQVPTSGVKFARDSLARTRGGRRTTTTTSNKTGRYVRATAVRKNNDLAFDATLRAAAPYQRRRPARGLAVKIEEPDIREKVRQKKTNNLLLFVVDASGSMGTRLMTETKGAILALLMEAYQKRDKVGLVAFKAMDAEVLLPPTNSIEIAKKLLEELPTGGKTPLGQGLLVAYQLIKAQMRQDQAVLPLMVVITDGRANVGLCRDKYYDGPQFGEIYREIYKICELFTQETRLRSIVIDAEEKRLGSFGRSKKLAESLNAKYYVLEDLADHRGIIETVKKEKFESEK
ncbi:MAG TPA: magnesium chelatase subunit D family protein [bacterium]|nr:magnesium chelatase subunit D family protein [bacterium]